MAWYIELRHRNKVIDKLKSKGILAVFHYLSLHKSPFYKDKYLGGNLVNADRYTDCVVSLPFFYELEKDTINFLKNEFYEAVKNT